MSRRILTRLLVTILALVALGGLIAFAVGSTTSGPARADQDQADAFHATADTGVINFYLPICAAADFVDTVGDRLSYAEQDAIGADDGDEQILRAASVLADEAEGIADRIDTSETPTRVHYLGEDTRNFTGAADPLAEALRQVIPAAESITNDGGADRWASAIGDVSDEVSAAVSAAPVNTRTTHERLSEYPDCAPLMTDSDIDQDMVVDEALHFHLTVDDVFDTITEGTEPLAQQGEVEATSVTELAAAITGGWTARRDAAAAALETLPGQLLLPADAELAADMMDYEIQLYALTDWTQQVHDTAAGVVDYLEQVTDATDPDELTEQVQGAIEAVEAEQIDAGKLRVQINRQAAVPTAATGRALAQAREG